MCTWYFIVDDRTTLLSTRKKLCATKEAGGFESEPRWFLSGLKTKSRFYLPLVHKGDESKKVLCDLDIQSTILFNKALCDHMEARNTSTASV